MCSFVYVSVCMLKCFIELTCCLVQEIGQKAAHDSLVTDDQHVLLPLQFHDHRLQPLHQVFIGLSQKRHKKKKESDGSSAEYCTTRNYEQIEKKSNKTEKEL